MCTAHKYALLIVYRKFSKIRHIKNNASLNFDLYLESNYHNIISCGNNKKLNNEGIVL